MEDQSPDPRRRNHWENRSQFDPRTYAVDDTLRDGSTIHIRAITPDDQVLLFEHFSGLSEQSRYARFFGVKRTLTREELARLTELDFDSQVGLVATLNDGVDEHIIGVGRYFRLTEPTRAEVAFAVLDQYQRRGIATLLLEHLCEIARQHGIVEFTAEVMATNRHMLDMLHNNGFQHQGSDADGIVQVSLALGDELATLR